MPRLKIVFELNFILDSESDMTISKYEILSVFYFIHHFLQSRYFHGPHRSWLGSLKRGISRTKSEKGSPFVWDLQTSDNKRPSSFEYRGRIKMQVHG